MPKALLSSSVGMLGANASATVNSYSKGNCLYINGGSTILQAHFGATDNTLFGEISYPVDLS